MRLIIVIQNNSDKHLQDLQSHASIIVCYLPAFAYQTGLSYCLEHLLHYHKPLPIIIFLTCNDTACII